MRSAFICTNFIVARFSSSTHLMLRSLVLLCDVLLVAQKRLVQCYLAGVR